MYSQFSHYIPFESGYNYIKNIPQPALSENRCRVQRNRSRATKESKSSPIKLKLSLIGMTSHKDRNMINPKVKYISSFPVRRRRDLPGAEQHPPPPLPTQPSATTQTNSPKMSKDTNTILSSLPLLLPLPTSDQPEMLRKTRWDGLGSNWNYNFLFFYNFFLSYYHILYYNIYLYRISNHLFL